MSIKALFTHHPENRFTHLSEIIAEIPDEISLFVSDSVSKSVEYLTHQHFDIHLIHLPQATTTSYLQVFLELNHQEAGTPILILATEDNEHVAMEAVETGAQAYILDNQVTPKRLIHHIRQTIGQQRLKISAQKNESRFKRLIENSLEGILIIDQARTIRFANHTAEAVFGQSIQNLSGTLFDHQLTLYQKTTLEIIGSNDTPLICDAIAIEITWQDAPHTLVSLRDMSIYKQVDTELQEAAKELQKRNEELDAFAHTVAHDLLTPLSLITGYAHLFEENYQTISKDSLKTYLHGIIWNGYKMQGIIDALLLLASTRQGDVFKERLDMGFILNEVRRRLATAMKDNQAEIRMPGYWPEAWGYSPWIEEVWVNYISNAIKYGGKPPTIELGANVMPNNQVRFWVRDYGSGIAPEDQGKLFSAFPNIKNSGPKSNGLGLSIVRRIIERLDGETGFEHITDDWGGSLFYFTLPTTLKKGD